MALNNVKFNLGKGGLGRPIPGTDYVSALLFYTASLPTGFTTGNRIKTVYSVQDAETLGILGTSVGETRSTATYTVTTKFTASDTFALLVNTIATTSPIDADALAGILTLCSFTAVTADAVSITTSASAIAAAVNAGTLVHGWSATSAVGVVTLTAAPGQGLFLNTGTPYSVQTTGAIVGTLTQNVVPGVPSEIDILHYHVSEFFREQPKGKLYVGVYATADVGTWASITLMQNFAQGEIKQMAIYQKTTPFANSQTTSIQAVLNTLASSDKPIWSVWYAAEISATSDITTINTSLKTLSNQNVSVTIGQDGAARGFKLFKATGKSITNVGEALGAVALAKVNESIAWLDKFQAASVELDVVAFANGQLFTSISDGAIVNLDTLGFCFLRKVVDLSGTYHNRPYTCTAPTSDYSFVQANRTIGKAIKNLRSVYLPQTGSPIKVNTDGTLTVDGIGYFKSLGKQALDLMQRDSELSNYNIIIDPTQNVLSTGELVITAQLQPTGTADFITVNIGFVDIITTTT